MQALVPLCRVCLRQLFRAVTSTMCGYAAPSNSANQSMTMRTCGDDIVPLIGVRRRPQLQDAIAALEVRLSADELAQIEAAVPAEAVAGARYNEIGMKHLNSEQRHAAG
jgi:hypothetical protein